MDLNFLISIFAKNKTVKEYHRYVLLKGDAYSVGKEEGELFKKNSRLIKLHLSEKPVICKEDFEEVNNILEKFSPNLNEEIRGFSESIGVPQRNLKFYKYSWLKPGCTQFALLPSITEGKNLLIGRNYDFSFEFDDLRFCETRIKGNFSHIGFSNLIFGRSDGINQHGLGITMSSAGVPVSNFSAFKKPKVKGLEFWAVERAILDTCKNIDEAIELVRTIPMSYNANFIVADSSGNVALIEKFDGQFAYKRITPRTKEKFISATNHLILPKLELLEKKKVFNSKERLKKIRSMIELKIKNGDRIKISDMKNILSAKYPEGLCCHYYNWMFGTISSAIYNISKREAHVTFGPPDVNEWRTFSLKEEKENQKYESIFPHEKIPKNFFDMVE